MKENQHYIWKGSEGELFLIPEGIEPNTGMYILTDLNGYELSVDLDNILPFKTTEEHILEYLKADYQEKAKSVHDALLTLNAFAVQTGKFDERSLKDLAKTEFGKLSNEEQEPFAFGKEIIEDFMSGINNNNASTEEQVANFQKTMGKVPEVMKYFDEHNLELAAKDPEAWAKTIHDKMFGEQEAARKSVYSEKLKKEVQESIARGLRKAGMEPIATSEKSDPTKDL